MFYFYALGTLLFSVVLAWLPIDSWKTWWWMTVSGCLRNSEICFAWCQSLAFLLLCQKLKQLDTITRKSDFLIRNKGIYHERFIDRVLFAGLAVANIFTIVYIVLVCVN